MNSFQYILLENPPGKLGFEGCVGSVSSIRWKRHPGKLESGTGDKL
jgi:hypothetical protein